ncbi:hypothetical protein P7C73_g4856, partial [Tremellales sp. Uapishka_1]
MSYNLSSSIRTRSQSRRTLSVLGNENENSQTHSHILLHTTKRQPLRDTSNVNRIQELGKETKNEKMMEGKRKAVHEEEGRVRKIRRFHSTPVNPLQPVERKNTTSPPIPPPTPARILLRQKFDNDDSQQAQEGENDPSSEFSASDIVMRPPTPPLMRVRPPPPIVQTTPRVMLPTIHAPEGTAALPLLTPTKPIRPTTAQTLQVPRVMNIAASPRKVMGGISRLAGPSGSVAVNGSRSPVSILPPRRYSEASAGGPPIQPIEWNTSQREAQANIQVGEDGPKSVPEPLTGARESMGPPSRIPVSRPLVSRRSAGTTSRRNLLEASSATRQTTLSFSGSTSNTGKRYLGINSSTNPSPTASLDTASPTENLHFEVTELSTESQPSSTSMDTDTDAPSILPETASLPAVRSSQSSLHRKPSMGLGRGQPSASSTDSTLPVRRKPSLPSTMSAKPMQRMVSIPNVPSRPSTAATSTSPRSISEPLRRSALSLSTRREGFSNIETSKSLVGLSQALDKLKMKKSESRAKLSLATSVAVTPRFAVLQVPTPIPRPRFSAVVPMDDLPGDRSIAALLSSTSGEGCFKGVVAFVDVRTAEGDDAGCIFSEMLRSLGAKVLARVSDSVTHLIYKSGKPTTLAWYRKQEDPKPFIVGISWVTKSKERGSRLDENEFKVEVGEEDVFQKRRKSMQPKQLAVHSTSALEAASSIAQARRKSLLYAPKVGSPLKKSYQTRASSDEIEE